MKDMHMEIILKYGKKDLKVNLNETKNFAGILSSKDAQKINNPKQKIAESLETPINSKPLVDIAKSKKDVCIVISDITRPVPNKIILPPILESLDNAGIDKNKVKILIATGIHRPNEGDELIELVGEEIAKNYNIINHFSKNDDDMIYVGDIEKGVPAYVNKHYINADLKILTGFIEPHMWAGYSGGRKSILPGISSINTLKYMHGPEMVAHPMTKYGILEGNPFHEAGLKIMEMTGADFIVNVTLDNDKDITGIFSGHPIDAHLKGCDFLSKYCVTTLSEPLDFIVTTNSGAPLDCNLYQTVKGITATTPVLKKNGEIIIASYCNEGLGSDEYIEVLNKMDTPENFVKRIMNKDFFIPDQWCAQETFQVMIDHPIYLYSDGIPKETKEKYGFKHIDSIEDTAKKLLEKYGENARWAVVPTGPMVILLMA
jgi:nickel-dependent lactate racemase